MTGVQTCALPICPLLKTVANVVASFWICYGVIILIRVLVAVHSGVLQSLDATKAVVNIGIPGLVLFFVNKK